jgi:4-hydroxy-3-methylbut-2-enyl diphosphate reductase
MRQVNIDSNSGFCFGVVYAIEMAEDYLDEFGSLFCLGDIVHNDKEVQRLENKGLKIIDHEELRSLKDSTVLIRAHGEPPETYRIALENNIELIDASCPVVLKLQNRVRNAYDSKAQIVIYGKPGHAEVNGLIGQTQQEAILITTEDDLDKIDYSRPVQLFSQTTKSTAGFYKMKALIEQQANEFKMNDTICRQVSNRDVQLRTFATEHDIILFVSGKKSSNGKVLFEVCRSVNPRTYFISDIDELENDWILHDDKVGICGATSTPMWLMENVAEAVKAIPS